ncbi:MULTISPECIES: NAD-dependent succinate-semialdehyde dehydrogenase [Bradyrhizobium]|uniref:NAD-dependent succinate-semialdehyde dehydrogenase n=1 Tax=Bradyrhizobium TaxID=374 RepID=UPI0004805539|nr:MULTISPECIES: NAD-dependent succinate-semialdehyde dehydrogenase [Bradyrhizobium]QOG23767.1 aldehyde dehydrogenase family protein [Bradyrhizobium sp. SEMIA]UFW53822.1 NAD-dependent succinate-semialdehyde dehydrogenase [Bradyrhizobium arachidis]
MEATRMYPKVQMFIAGEWTDGTSGKSEDILNPATGQPIGKTPHASKADLDRALEAARAGFEVWRKTSPFDRYKLMRKAADIIRSRAAEIAPVMTMEQGKPVVEAQGETMLAGDLIDWFSEEARRAYGRIVPPRMGNVSQLVTKEPVGPVAAFTPWNFPINQAVRKISAALAAGCSIIVKGPEETPASCMELVRAYADAGIPPGVVQLVFGVPSEVSEYLIPHPIIRKISFTGSTAVGKHLAALAGLHMKRVTMELGGHAPAIVFADADLDNAAKILSANKFRNAGQVCVSPTRFLVHESVYKPFVDKFVAAAKSLKVGNGLDKDTRMGPLANPRRVDAMEGLVSDAVQRGAKVQAGGKRIGNEGFFFEPTVITDVPRDARIMNEEPFGPLAPITSFRSYDEVVAEANRLPYGLAAYAYTTSTKTMQAIGSDIESGMVSINHHGLALPEVPFGGIKDSGYGSEGGLEAIEGYLNTKFVTQASA